MSRGGGGGGGDGLRQPGGAYTVVHEAGRDPAAPRKKEGRRMIDPACADQQLPQIDLQRIMEMIPHRHPFLMIDKVVDVVANQQATGIKNVSIDEYYFQDR